MRKSYDRQQVIFEAFFVIIITNLVFYFNFGNSLGYGEQKK